MVKQFRGFRFEQELYDAFCRLAEKQGLTTTKALERFMEGSVAADTLVFADKRVLDFEAEARVLVDWLTKGKHFYRDEIGGEFNISGRLLTLLPKVADTALKKKIEEALKSSVPKQDNI